jgi:hypothetical protein
MDGYRSTKRKCSRGEILFRAAVWASGLTALFLLALLFSRFLFANGYLEGP